MSGSPERVSGSRRREANAPNVSCLCGTWQPRCGLEASSHPIARAGQSHSGHRTAKKRTPAAERPGESLTRRIGQYPPRKGADVAGWLVAQTRA
jgi:hypothetical protein